MNVSHINHNNDNNKEENTMMNANHTNNIAPKKDIPEFSITLFETNRSSGMVEQNANGSYTLSSAEPTAPIVNIALVEQLCFISEEEIDPKELAMAAFSEEDLAGCLAFKISELEDLIEVDPALLCELYQLCAEHSNFAPQKLLDMVRFLNQKGFIPEFVIQKLITATYREVEKILESNEPEHAFLKFLK